MALDISYSYPLFYNSRDLLSHSFAFIIFGLWACIIIDFPVASKFDYPRDCTNKIKIIEMAGKYSYYEMVRGKMKWVRGKVVAMLRDFFCFQRKK